MTHKLILIEADDSSASVDVCGDEFLSFGHETFDFQTELAEMFHFINKFTSEGACVIEFSWAS